MTWVDWTILVILGVSMVVSVFRGLAREVLSLLAWVLAGWAAFEYAPLGDAWLAPWVPAPSIRLLLGGGAVFVVVLLGLGLVNALAGRLIRSSGLSGTDRSLGMLFGLARGIAIVTVMVLAAGATPVPQDPWWRESTLLGHFERLAVEVRTLLPEPVSGFIRFPGDPPTASGLSVLPGLPLAPGTGVSALPALGAGSAAGSPAGPAESPPAAHPLPRSAAQP